MSQNKVAILTLPLHANYGGILQAWALKTVLERAGYRPTLLMPHAVSTRLDHIILNLKRVAKKMLGQYEGESIKEYTTKETDRFIRQNFNIQVLSSLKDFNPDKFEAIIVGSDQVWRGYYFNNMWHTDNSADAFLDFIADDNKIKRISYAASLGISDWDFSKEDTERIKSAIKRFDAISVREESAVNVLKDILDIEAAHLLDPTMLLAADDYIKLAGCREIKKDKIISYILDSDEEKEELISKVKNQYKLPHVELKRDRNSQKLLSVKEWIKGVAEAAVVITDSFHGCVFSIIFGKPLIFCTNAGRGNARFESLINTFGIENNLVDANRIFDATKDYSLPIGIRERLEKLQQKSHKFLMDSLRNK